MTQPSQIERGEILMHKKLSNILPSGAVPVNIRVIKYPRRVIVAIEDDTRMFTEIIEILTPSVEVRTS